MALKLDTALQWKHEDRNSNSETAELPSCHGSLSTYRANLHHQWLSTTQKPLLWLTLATLWTSKSFWVDTTYISWDIRGATRNSAARTKHTAKIIPIFKSIQALIMCLLKEGVQLQWYSKTTNFPCREDSKQSTATSLQRESCPSIEIHPTGEKSRPMAKNLCWEAQWAEERFQIPAHCKRSIHHYCLFYYLMQIYRRENGGTRVWFNSSFQNVLPFTSCITQQ